MECLCLDGTSCLLSRSYQWLSIHISQIYASQVSLKCNSCWCVGLVLSGQWYSPQKTNWSQYWQYHHQLLPPFHSTHRSRVEQPAWCSREQTLWCHAWWVWRACIVQTILHNPCTWLCSRQWYHAYLLSMQSSFISWTQSMDNAPWTKDHIREEPLLFVYHCQQSERCAAWTQTHPLSLYSSHMASWFHMESCVIAYTISFFYYQSELHWWQW